MSPAHLLNQLFPSASLPRVSPTATGVLIPSGTNFYKRANYFILLNSVTITRQECLQSLTLCVSSSQLITTKRKVPLFHSMKCGMYRMFLLPAFITLSNGYYHYDRLASPHHRLLNLNETQRRTTLAEHRIQCWANAYRSSREKKPRVGGRADSRPEPLPSEFILINGFALLHKFIMLMYSINSPISFPN
jgi:hypothetical protein